VTGGSQGARIFADVVPPAIAALPEAIRARLLVTQQCRAEDLARTETAYRAAGVVADLAPFFPDIAGRLATAHLVIARAGASTIAELECAGRPSVLVPLPSAIDDHQNANARALAETDAAWVYPQSAFTAPALAERLVGLFGVPARLASAAAAAAALARPHAARDLADRVLALIRQTAMGTA
jgi:UDP-N-acetylglucosamine--N-acetylmuramyl-(pentapeptide) pyrophosphoryl-undecaprenol N-acetylglucosamine transferase